MSKITESLQTELKHVVELLNTNPEKVESIGDFVVRARFDYDFIKHIICGITEVWVMDKAIQVISDTWNEYLRKDEDICYIITYTEDYSIETGGVYEVKKPLMKMPKFLDIERNLSEIKESELNRRKVNERFEKEISSMKDEKPFESDFDHLKVWQDNPNIDYYLSKSHWNYHVNKVIYIYLQNRYWGNEVGVYINMALLNGSESTKIDYNQIYGVMFNKAYNFCSYVLTTPVPETKITKLLKQAEELCDIKLAAPIISYNILVMTCFILCFANDYNDDVDSFLCYLSNHNDTHFFDDKFHHFEDYMKIGLETVAAIMIDSRLQPPGKLRPGYDYKGRDESLRRNIPWYRVSAEKLEKRVEEADKKQVVTDIEKVSEEIKNASCSWDDSMDYIFNKKVKPQEIEKALKNAIPNSKLKGRPQHYVSYRILKELKYISSDTTERDYLRWINLHFNLGWTNDNDLKFSRINNKSEFDKFHPSKWKSINTKSNIEKQYYNYVIRLKNTFTKTIENGKEVDNSESFEHLKDWPIFLSEATLVIDKYLVNDEDYINNGK